MLGELAPYVSIVIPVFNEERYLSSCLSSVMALNYPKDHLEILLIDNGSTDRSLEIARGFHEVIIYVKENVKVGAVRNHGVQKAKGTIVVFLDSDCIVDREWLNHGVGTLMESPDDVIGGQYLLREDPSWLEKHWMLSSPNQRARQNALVGGCVFISKEVFENVGGFDETLNAGEDNDLTKRLRDKHFNVKINPSLSVVHLGNPSRVRPFLMRQLWHSSDYINGLPKTLGDKTFLLTLVFLGGIVFFLSALFFVPTYKLTLSTSAFIVLICPAILSVKRITRAGGGYKRPFDIVSIYLVDWLYLIGRSLGVCSGIKNRLVLKPDAKVGRR